LRCQAQPPQIPQATQAAAFSAEPGAAQVYTLPAEKLAKAIALGRIRNILSITGSLWSLGVLGFLLASRACTRMEEWAEQIFHRRWAQGLLFFSTLLTILSLADLPLAAYGHHFSLSYGISVQGWGSWLFDQAKALVLTVFVGTPVLLLFNWIVRRWPGRYWLPAWAATLPLMLAVTFAEPLIEPFFNHYEPLDRTHAALVAQLERVVARTGIDIPPERMFLMKAGVKTNGINAYVSGLGATKRYVMWDTTTDRLPEDEILFIFGHESGHYVLNHILEGLACSAIGLFFVFWGCAAAAAWLDGRIGVRWGAHPISSRSGFVLLFFTFSIAGFLLEPVVNTVSRHFEHQADIYGQEAIHGIVPDPQKTAIAAFNHLGEAWLDDPNPSPFMEFWLYSHPSVQTRATFAAHYNPWAQGGRGRFFDK
jgi:Zn-dependent protease with chaperone function